MGSESCIFVTESLEKHDVWQSSTQNAHQIEQFQLRMRCVKTNHQEAFVIYHSVPRSFGQMKRI
jgi:hypothetical protein